jgi:hypothetical protein
VRARWPSRRSKIDGTLATGRRATHMRGAGGRGSVRIVEHDEFPVRQGYQVLTAIQLNLDDLTARRPRRKQGRGVPLESQDEGLTIQLPTRHRTHWYALAAKKSSETKGQSSRESRGRFR